MANDQGLRYGAFPIFANDSPPKILYYKANTAVNIFRGQFVAINSLGQAMTIVRYHNVLQQFHAKASHTQFLTTRILLMSCAQVYM